MQQRRRAERRLPAAYGEFTPGETVQFTVELGEELVSGYLAKRSGPERSRTGDVVHGCSRVNAPDGSDRTRG